MAHYRLAELAKSNIYIVGLIFWRTTTPSIIGTYCLEAASTDLNLKAWVASSVFQLFGGLNDYTAVILPLIEYTPPGMVSE